MSGDPFGIFYTWKPTIERLLGVNASGPVYAEPTNDVKCQIRLVSELVITSDGRQVTITATLNTYRDTEAVPVGSRVTLPAALGGLVGLVAVEGVHDTQIAGVPTFYRFQLERPTPTR